MNKISRDRIENAVACIACEVSKRLYESAKPPLDEQDLWTELCCCMLSSQVPYELAKAAAERIHETGVLCDPAPPRELEAKVHRLLSIPLHVNGADRRYRFPIRGAQQIAGALGVVCREFGSLHKLLERQSDAPKTRAWMAAHVPGIGPKQASMFLRNVAQSYDLAVIDRHVLRYMNMIRLCDGLDFNVTTITKYERHETQLRRHAESIGYSVGLIDWAIWIVMRAASRIGQEWAS